MTTSGTYTWGPSVAEIIDEAAERAGLDPDALTVRQQLSARRSLNAIMTHWANIGVHQWTIDQRTLTTTQSTANYTLDSEVLDILDAVLRRDGVDTPMYPIGREDYLNLADKTIEGRPDRFFVDRKRDIPEVFLWQTPENSTDVMVYNTIRRFQDIKSDMTQTPDIPARWYEALFAELAARLAQKFTNEQTITTQSGNSVERYDPSRWLALKRDAQEAFILARAEDRERSPTVFRVEYR